MDIDNDSYQAVLLFEKSKLKTKINSTNRVYAKVGFYSFLSLLVYEWIFWMLAGFGGGVGGTSTDSFVFLLFISILLGLYLFFTMKWRANIPQGAYILYCLYLICNLVALFRGVLSATNYYEWKSLLIEFGGGLALFSPIAFVLGVNFESCRRIFKLTLISLSFGLFLIPLQAAQALASEETFARLMLPAGFFILFAPYLKRKTFLILIVIIAASLVLTLEWRTMVIRLSISVAILLIYYFRKFIPRNFYLIFLILCYALPIYFLIVGVVTGKSVFANESESNQKTFVTAAGEEQHLAADTRTFLYVDVLTDLSTDNTIIQGKGGVTRYKSRSVDEGEQKAGRFNVEVGALKLLMTTGLIGLILHGALNFVAAFVAIKRSNNFLCKMLALFLGSYWLIFFIENFYAYNLNFFLTWVVTGLCLSKKFRNLTDRQVKQWLAH